MQTGKKTFTDFADWGNWLECLDLMVEAPRSSETSVSVYKLSRRNIQEYPTPVFFFFTTPLREPQITVDNLSLSG